ncbi:hypothetical protein K6U06_18305 [Acidiferrimicrobium sp. IK]|uniref:hypothetical protein n=1 Tax=Acidiferrimicrobium sp. IK TaxID=2871700 RepID=UPI0021CB7804|nr:hypothetical protein [Acidiferrimicrobium sp. IK]MCU4186325.1 hypothetical protein [Acidiferrimicrobium sp. IK]
MTVLTRGGRAEPARRRAEPLQVLFAYRVLSRAYFHLPVLLVFLDLRQYSFEAIESILALYGVAVLAAGFVTGRVRRTASPRWILTVGEILKAIGIVLVGYTAGGLLGLVVGQVLNGAGYALTSSVETGLVSQLAEDPSAVGKIQSNTQAWIFAMVMASGILGAIIFQHQQHLVFVLSVVACLLSAVIATRVATGIGPAAAAPTGSFGDAPTTVWNRKIMSWVGYYAAIRSVSLAGFVGIIPYLLFVKVHVSLPFFGAMLALFNIGAFVVNKAASAVLAALGDQALAAATVVAVTACMLLLAVSQAFAVAGLAIFVLGLGAGAARPVTQRGLSDLAAPVRSAVTGRMEQLTGLTNAAILVGAGALLQAGEATSLLVGLGLALLVVGLIVVALGRPPAASPADGDPAPAHTQRAPERARSES